MLVPAGNPSRGKTSKNSSCHLSCDVTGDPLRLLIWILSVFESCWGIAVQSNRFSYALRLLLAGWGSPMMTMELSKEARADAIASIKRYFEENMPEPIGDLAA